MRELKKQDRTSSRLPTDTERKYKLGQIELTKEELDRLKSELVIDEYLSITSPNAIANKTVTNALNNKVTKEAGKTLSTNDFTNEYKKIIDDMTESNPNQDTYSTEERAVAIWIDDKTVYRKVIQVDTKINNTTLEIPHNIPNIEYIWIKEARFNVLGGLSYTLPIVGYNGNITDKAYCWADATNIYLYSNGGWGTNWIKTFVIEYTKEEVEE